MFLNYLAGAVSLILVASAFIPWVTVWFYSLKGIESLYGIIILVAGLLGAAVAVFQHLAGQARGRTFILLSSVTLVCEALYYKKLVNIGGRLNDIVELLTDSFGQTLLEKARVLVGDSWLKIFGKVVSKMGWEGSVSSFDFVGGGLVLAALCSVVLLVVGILLEKNKVIDENVEI